MPPTKASRATAPDDHTVDTGASAKRQQANQTLPRGRRNGAAAGGKESAHPNGHSEAQRNSASQTLNGTTQSRETAWSQTPLPILRAYRTAHRLPSTTSSFKNPMASTILGCGIGKQSPTMKCPRSRRRIPKEALATAVRKNFNALPVNETEVVVALVYRVRMKDKSFRLRFPATKPPPQIQHSQNQVQQQQHQQQQSTQQLPQPSIAGGGGQGVR